MKNNIAKIRKKKGLTQIKLAEMVGIGNVWLCEVEKGRGGSTVLIRRIAKELEVPMSDIFLEQD